MYSAQRVDPCCAAYCAARCANLISIHPMLLTALLLLLISSPVLFLVRPHRSTLSGWIAAVPPALITAWLCTQIGPVSAGEFVTERYAWATSLGLELSLRLDGLSLFFGLIVAGIGTTIAVYTAYYLEDDPRQGYFYSVLFIFMASMLGLVWADNLLVLFVFWEGTSISSYLLVGYKSDKKAAVYGAQRAFIVTGLGGLALLAGGVLLGQEAGTYAISEMLATPGLTESAIYPAALILMAIAAFTKSAQFPFQFWLPGAMQAPTPASAYLHSATMVKAGIYLLARLHPGLSGTPLWFWLLLLVGGATMLLGAVSALRYYDLKRILAYATISQLGILTMLLAFYNEEAYTAVVVGILAHALYKGPLFMIAGIVDHATGTRDVRRLANLGRAMPLVTVAAVLAALSMAGLPPFMGFLAKETLLADFSYYFNRGGVVVGVLGLIAAGLAGTFFVAYSLTLLWEPFFRRLLPDGVSPESGERLEQAEVHHAPSLGFVLPPLALAAVGTALPLMLPLINEPIFSPPASAIAGETIHVHVELWHGFTAPLAISLAAIALGVVIFWRRETARGLLNRIPPRVDGVRVFEAVYDGAYRLARQITQLVQGGTLAAQASVILLTAVYVVAYGLIRFNLVGHLDIALSTLPEFDVIAISLLAIVAAIVTVRAQTRLNAIISIGVVGVTVTLFFVFFSAPDLALTQLLIEVLTVVLLVLVFYKIPPNVHPKLPRLRFYRNLAVSLAVGFFGFALVLLSSGEPVAPRISDFFSLNAVPAAHGANIVNVILVDFRGFDTMGEITVLAIAALGGYALLRSARLRPVHDQHIHHPEQPETQAKLLAKRESTQNGSAANPPVIEGQAERQAEQQIDGGGHA